MQATLTFHDDFICVGVISENTTWNTGDKKLFYGNIFKNGYECGKDIEFEVWEDSSTEGERLDKPVSSQPFYMDLIGFKD